MPQNTFDDTSTFVKVLTRCRQASSPWLSQCRPGSMSPNGVTKPRWAEKSDRVFLSLDTWNHMFYVNLFVLNIISVLESSVLEIGIPTYGRQKQIPEHIHKWWCEIFTKMPMPTIIALWWWFCPCRVGGTVWFHTARLFLLMPLPTESPFY